MLSVLAFVACALAHDTPVDFGRAELARNFHAAGLDARAAGVDLRIAPGGSPESFTIRSKDGKVVIEGADPAGAMYGAMELGERVRMHGASALDGPEVKGSPFLRDRGLNVFLTLPWDYAKNNTDYDPAALTDPARWWFANDDYWTTLLDLMARARLNWLDLHGTWDISVTDAPNLYAYFVQCPDFPKVGVAPEIKAKNLERLNAVIAMAHARGIRVSLMAYEARLRTPHNPNPPYPGDEKTAYAYTRQAVELMIKGAAGLDAIGFRIGESGHGGEFFNCYTEAVKNSGRDIPLYTRSWVTRRAKVLPLAAASSDFTVEIKYNGEQWGPPYPIVGGRIAGQYSYSFEDYLSDPGAGPFAKRWPGNKVEGGEWPGEPYKIVWQVRLNGTHRIFPFNDPEWVRRSIKGMKLGTASGYTIEPINAYFPASSKYYTADPANVWCDWIVQRDELFITSWGRLGYDPATPAEVLAAPMKERFGTHAKEIGDAWAAASRIIPTAFTAYSLGPDHRSHAPELEWGGDVRTFIDREPFDSHVFMSVKEMLAIKSSGGTDGRLTPLDAANLLDDLRKAAEPLAKLNPDDVPQTGRDQARELATSAAMLSHLAVYYAEKLRAAEALARSEAGGGDAANRQAGAHARAALAAWQLLSDSPESNYYKPFTDRLRLGTNTFHWRNELEKVKKDADSFPSGEALASDARPKTTSSDPVLSWSVEGDRISCKLTGRGVAFAWLLYKPLPSSTFFHRVEMARARHTELDTFIAGFPREACGHAIAAEIQTKDGVRRIPSWDPGPPYLIIPSLPNATPTYYSSEEALTYLKPSSLSPDRYSMMVLAPRAYNTHRNFPVSVQRKLIAAVERGLPLLILQQDYTSGRYPLAWLGPEAPKLENAPGDLFDPGAGGGLILKIQTAGILFQKFVPAPGWEILGNGGVAQAHRGKGDIYMVQARLMQRMHVPECAAMLKMLLTPPDPSKPLILVDAGTEGGDLATSCIADFMNAHNIQFLTLGEVIAREQGLDCLTPVPGPIAIDSVLEGRGRGIMTSYLNSKVKAAAHRPVPASKDEFDARRATQKKELMRSLGLDPLPPRTDLNARITGTFKREGYRVERLVFDSRPGFPVTALIYIPEAPAGTKFPVIVNPHGHWAHKKAEPVVQSRAIFQALHGYLAIVIDSPGHSFEGDTPIERRWQGPHDDFTLALSVGSTTGVYVWDLMRALDYLQTRPDTDMTRIGLTGTSGGGLATLYAFAADDRFTAAVPVCYATSLEVNPNNGCLCNHVPGTLQIGDRADVLAIRAPAPVMVIGATNDVEFPPAGMKLTGEKLKALYSVYGAADKTAWLLVDSGHDYNRPMREAAIGFFDKHLRGVGDGSPVPEPPFATEPPESKDLVCLPEVPKDLRTMRDLAKERLATAKPKTFAEVAALNGGIPSATPLKARIVPEEPVDSRRRFITFESEPGLTIPGVLLLPDGPVKNAMVLVSERGKTAAAKEFGADVMLASGVACLCIDVRGYGELSGLDPRLMAYLGTADAFAMGWDAARACRALRELAPGLSLPADLKVGVAGRGPCASQAAMFAALLAPDAVSSVIGRDAIREYADCFGPGMPASAIQWRAADSAPLSHLRSLVRQPADWEFQGGGKP